jgi:hypothetical protein
MLKFNQIREFIKTEFNNLMFDIEFLNQVNTDLLKNCTKDIDLPFYNYSRYEYEKEYFKITESNNFSLIIKKNNQVVGLWYLMLIQVNGTPKLYSLGVNESVSQPFFFNLSKTNKNKLIDLTLNLLIVLKKKFNLKEINISEHIHNNKLSKWGRELSKLCNQSQINIIYISDISNKNKEATDNIIKNNKNFINIDYSNKELDKLWTQFQELHKKKTGKLTRSTDSWEIQKKMIINQEASLYGYIDKSNLLAGIFIYHSKSVAYYSVGVLGQFSRINDKLFKFATACLKKIKIEKLILGIQNTNIKEKKYIRICESNKQRSDYQEPLLMFTL